MFAGAIEQCCSIVHQSSGRGQRLAGRAEVDIGFLIVVEVSIRCVDGEAEYFSREDQIT